MTRPANGRPTSAAANTLGEELHPLQLSCHGTDLARWSEQVDGSLMVRQASGPMAIQMASGLMCHAHCTMRDCFRHLARFRHCRVHLRHWMACLWNLSGDHHSSSCSWSCTRSSQLAML